MSLEAHEVCEGVEVLNVGVQMVCEERNIGNNDREVTGVLKEAALAQSRQPFELVPAARNPGFCGNARPADEV